MTNLSNLWTLTDVNTMVVKIPLTRISYINSRNIYLWLFAFLHDVYGPDESGISLLFEYSCAYRKPIDQIIE